MIATLVHKSFLVFVPLKTTPANNQVIQLPNNDLLNGKEILGVQMFASNDLSKAPDGTAIISDLSGATLTLLNESMKVIDDSPAVNFNQRLNSGVVRGIDTIIKFNMPASFIKIYDSSAYSINQNNAIEFLYKD